MQHDGGVRQPCDDALGDDIGLPGDAVDPRAMQLDPVVDNGACIGTGLGALVGADMAQPGEGMEPDREMIGGEFQEEGRLVAGIEHAAGKRKAALVDFLRHEGVERAQIGRSDDQPAGRSTGKADRHGPRQRKEARQTTQGLRDVQIGQPLALRQSHDLPKPWLWSVSSTNTMRGHRAIIPSLVDNPLRIEPVRTARQDPIDEAASAHSFKV